MDYHHNGNESRKMIMAYVVIVLIAIAFIGTALVPALSAGFSTFIMGLLGAAGIFTGAATGVQWMAHQANLKGMDQEADPSEAPANNVVATPPQDLPKP